MQYRIKWRNRHKTLIVTVGIGRYTQQGAARQAAKWLQHFPENSYYIERV